MTRLTVLIALIALAALATPAEANRVPSRKVDGIRTPGVRGDVTIPYLNNDFSALGVYPGVAPIIYSYPVVDDRKNAGVLPVHNLMYYGARQAFGRALVGAEPRKPNQLRPEKPKQ